MKNLICLTAFIANLSSMFAQNPIVLTNANMPTANDTLRYTNVNLNSIGNYSLTGTNYTWNFKNVISTTEGRRDFKAALNTPYGFFFLAPGEYGEKIADTLIAGTGTITITKFYNYYRKTTTPLNAFIADGVGLSINNIPVPCYYTDKDELYIFPLSYPKLDSTTFKFSTPTTSLLPISYSKAGYRTTRVDGWGTVITPYGTENVIRLVSTQYSKDTIKLNLPIPNLPPIKIGLQNNQRSYQWLSLNSKIPFFEISGTLNGPLFTPNTARYRGFDVSKNPIDLTALKPESTQPVFNYSKLKHQIEFNAPESIQSFILVNTSGAQVVVKDAQYFKTHNYIDLPKLLPSGIYYPIIIGANKINNSALFIYAHD